MKNKNAAQGMNFSKDTRRFNNAWLLSSGAWIKKNTERTNFKRHKVDVLNHLHVVTEHYICMFD